MGDVAKLNEIGRVLFAGYDASELHGYMLARQYTFASQYGLLSGYILLDSNFEKTITDDSVSTRKQRVLWVFGRRPSSYLCLGFLRIRDVVQAAGGDLADDNQIAFVEVASDRIYVGYNHARDSLSIVALRLNMELVNSFYAEAKRLSEQLGRGDLRANQFPIDVIQDATLQRLHHGFDGLRQVGASASSERLHLALFPATLAQPAKVYVLPNSAGWGKREPILLPDPPQSTGSEEYAHCILGRGDRLLVSDPRAGGPDRTIGAVYQYRIHGSGDAESVEFVSSVLSDSPEYVGFGSHLDVTNKTLLVGSPADELQVEGGGGIELYDLDFGDWLGSIRPVNTPKGSHIGSNFCVGPDQVVFAYCAPSRTYPFGAILGLDIGDSLGEIRSLYEFQTYTYHWTIRNHKFSRTFAEHGTHPDFKVAPLKYDAQAGLLHSYFSRSTSDKDRFGHEVRSPGVLIVSKD